MKYIHVPSLQHIVLVENVVMLWNQEDIRDLISNVSGSLFFQWQNIENRLIEKSSLLPIPNIIKKKVESFIKPIGSQILKWMQYHSIGGYIHTNLLAAFCWTPQGTIDRQKTAHALVRNMDLDIIKRYKLACIYCLKNDIVDLWNKIPENCRQSLSNGYSSDVSQHSLRFYWTHIMQVGFNNPLYSYQYMFESCAKGGNIKATEYFLQKLNQSEREESLVKTAIYVEDAEVLLYLLSQMSEQQEREVFKSNPYKILLPLLDWPLQNLFSEVVDHMWEFLPEKDFDRLLYIIMDKIRNGYKDYSYEKLFKNVWQKSPSGFKRYVRRNIAHCRLLQHLFAIKDKDNMKFLFQDANYTEKRVCIYSYVEDKIYENFVSEEEWEFLSFLLEEWIPSRSERIKFNEEFLFSIPDHDVLKCRFENNKHKWDQLLFPSYFDHKCNKRELEDDEESHPSKTLHNIQ